MNQFNTMQMNRIPMNSMCMMMCCMFVYAKKATMDSYLYG